MRNILLHPPRRKTRAGEHGRRHQLHIGFLACKVLRWGVKHVELSSCAEKTYLR